MTKKLLQIISIVSGLTLALLLFPNLTLAQNKCGINIGPNYDKVDEALDMAKAGGWAVSRGGNAGS